MTRAILRLVYVAGTFLIDGSLIGRGMDPASATPLAAERGFAWHPPWRVIADLTSRHDGGSLAAYLLAWMLTSIAIVHLFMIFDYDRGGDFGWYDRPLVAISDALDVANRFTSGAFVSKRRVRRPPGRKADAEQLRTEDDRDHR